MGLYRGIKNELPDYASIPFILQTTTFTSVGSGEVAMILDRPMKSYALCVTADATPASWDVRLEGSLDNLNFTSILTHTGIVGIGLTLFTKADVIPALQIRSRVAALVLAPATLLTVVILGVQ